MGDFKQGVACLAYDAGVDIAPVYIHGTYQARNYKDKFPRRTKIKIVYADPINIKEYAEFDNKSIDQKLEAITEKIKESIIDLKTRELLK